MQLNTQLLTLTASEKLRARPPQTSPKKGGLIKVRNIISSTSRPARKVPVDCAGLCNQKACMQIELHDWHEGSALENGAITVYVCKRPCNICMAEILVPAKQDCLTV